MNLRRAPTENDELKLFMEYRDLPDYEWYCKGKVMYEWLEAGLDELRFSLLSLEAEGPGLRVSSPATFDFSASHHDAVQLWKAKHWTDLIRRPETLLCLDLAQRGLGSASCGPDTLEPYRLPPGPYRLELAFSPRGCRSP